MKRLVLATRNPGKLRELLGLLENEPIEIVSIADHPEVSDVDESGKTFEENARIKAVHAANALGEWALGEDSGLEVDALDGRPGVFSARWAGTHGDDEANNAKLIQELEGRRDREARYVCAMVLARPDGTVAATTRGACEGRIAHEPRGSMGFGYDPYFWPEGRAMSMAELEPQAKDLISHRGQALRAMLALLRMHLGLCPTGGSPGDAQLR